MKNLAVIPARSGSKGLKDKNILPMNGHPMLWYTIRAALDSQCFDEIFVSTDSEQYAEIARECGAQVPFLRSAELATDTANSWDLVREALRRYRELGREFDTFALLQPTSPLRDGWDIVGVYRMLEERNANAVVSVCECEHSPLWTAQLPDDGNLAVFDKLFGQCKARQLLGGAFHRLNGAVYLARVPYFEIVENIYQERCFGYIMSHEHSFDIDDRFDFDICDFLLRKHSASFTITGCHTEC